MNWPAYAIKEGTRLGVYEIRSHLGSGGMGEVYLAQDNIAIAYELLNKPAEAIKWLPVAADDGFPCYPWVENDANLNSLRKDEQFIGFMAKLKQQWERYKGTL